MALFHLSVTQTKRSAGQSAIASAAYRAGERLYSEYYGEYSDYTRKGGVICSDILLPSHAPPEYADRQTLWNAVEKAERGKNAQLAYSFDIALQNEFSLEENIALARQFLLENFVSRGMVVDFAVHQPDREDGGIPNPHFHVLCPIRPIEQNGKWGLKQRRVYELDEDGNRIRDANGKYAGYVVRTRVRDERGCLRGCDYYVYEYPQTPSSGSGGSAESVPPMLEPLASDSAVLGNPMQLNKEIQNKEKQNTDLILSEGEAVRTKVRDNIELDLLCRNQPESAPVMQEIYELVVETIQLRSPVLRLGSNLFPMALVRERLLQLTSEHIRFVLDGLRNLHTDVKNLKKYLLTMLFNAPVTLNGRTMLDVRKSVGGGSRPMLA